MVSRSDQLSLAGTRALFSSFTNGAQMQELVESIMRGATTGPEEAAALEPKELAQLKLQYRQLAANLSFPKPPRASAKSAKVDLGDMQDIDACVTAMANIGKAQAAGMLTHDEAEDLRKTVTATGALHRSKAGEDLLARIEEEGASAWFLEAGATPEEDAERVKALSEAARGN